MRAPFVRTLVYVGLYLLLLAVGWLDFITGPEIGFSLFYVIPIMLGGWYYYESRATALVLPILAAIVWLLADFFSKHAYSSPWIPYWNSFLRLGVFLIVGQAISRLRRAHSNEQALSRSDPLTGVYNARYFAELVSREISRAARFSEPLSFAYFDVDNFKTVNDTLGHAQGDELLHVLTGAVRAHIRDIDIIARLGGDEFGILFPRTDSDQARAVMSKVDAIVRQDLSARWNVTLSAGVITFRTPPKSWDEMVKAADALMYKAKRGGKDKTAFDTV
jgi:diguanylate cyclase (GGDEF)-like protein